MTDVVPKLVGGVGEINFGKQYRQGNRVYDGNSIAMCLNAQPVGNAGGYSYLYAIDETKLSEKESDNLNKINENMTKIIPFNYVSLFSGIGGFEQALNKLGGTCVLASEIDKFANQAYEVLYGHSTAGDITKIKAEDIPDHDVLVGGFPCQAFSVAGKRGGFEDARGTLFFEMARIAKEKQPKMFLAENVKGLLSHDKGRTMDTIVTTLSDIGYRVDFEVLNSKYFGVPQNRERVFLIGIREDLLENEAWDIPKGSTVVPKAKRRLAEYEDLKTFNFDWPEQSGVTTRLRDVLETEVDEKFYLSEEKTDRLVAQLTKSDKEDAPNILHNIYGGFKENKPRVFKDESPTIRTSAGGGHLPSLLEESEEPRINVVGNTSETTKHGNFNVFDEAGLCRTVAARDYKDPVKVLREEVHPVLTPDRIEKRQNGRRLKEDGQDRHGVAIREIIEKDVKAIASKTRPNTEIGVTYKVNGDIRSHRLDARKSGISELQINHEDNPSNTVTSAHAPKIYGESSKYRIRKLTPLECWRLQGFPDEAHEAVKAAGISDSQRYKMAGNAVTVNVIEALGRNLTTYLSGASVPSNVNACEPSTFA